jgi:hypothetical protein
MSFIFHLLKIFALLRAVYFKNNCGNIKFDDSTVHGSSTLRKAAILVSLKTGNYQYGGHFITCYSFCILWK